MSTGIVVCSECWREVHQDGLANNRPEWLHCESELPICASASAVHPGDRPIVGKWCGADGDHEARQQVARAAEPPRKPKLRFSKGSFKRV